MTSLHVVCRVATLHIRCCNHAATHLVQIPSSLLLRRSAHVAKEDRYHGLIKGHERQSMYIMDKGVAKLIADTVPKSCIVVESNPGPGLVTRALLDAGVQKVIAVESKDKFLPQLNALRDEVGPDRLDVHHMDFFLRNRRYLEGLEFMKETEKKIMECIPQRSWTDPPPVCIVGVLPPKVEKMFLPYLFYGPASQEGFFNKGRVQWLLTLSGQAVRPMLKLKSSEDLRLYNRTTVLYEAFYDIQCIEKLPRKVVFPPLPIKKKFFEVHTENMFIDRSSSYLTQLMPRAGLMTTFQPEALPGFMVFLQQILQRRKWKLISRMEYLVPGCSEYLIAMNFKATKTTGETLPNEYVRIYNEMLKWPEYQDSSLKEILFKTTSYLQEDYIPEADHPS